MEPTAPGRRVEPSSGVGLLLTGQTHRSDPRPIPAPLPNSSLELGLARPSGRFEPAAVLDFVYAVRGAFL
jgi:hypothetical protein